MRRLGYCFFVLFFLQSIAHASMGKINPLDKISVARGAHLFMAYCSGCHALKYTQDSSLLGEFKLGQYVNAPIKTSMPAKDAYQWFGQIPADLSLIAQTRGQEWLYQYLTSFYPDVHQPYGENNTLLPNVMMPNPFPSNAYDPITKAEMITDIVTFLTYVSDPSIVMRYKIGPFVLGIGFVLLILLYCLKQLYWKKRART